MLPIDFSILDDECTPVRSIDPAISFWSIEQTGLHFVEGPDRYSSQDVAIAFATTLGRPVNVQSVPRGWLATLTGMGFSDKAAESFANMTAVTLDATFPTLNAIERGATSLHDYLLQLVRSGSFQ